MTYIYTIAKMLYDICALEKIWDGTNIKNKVRLCFSLSNINYFANQQSFLDQYWSDIECKCWYMLDPEKQRYIQVTTTPLNNKHIIIFILLDSVSRNWHFLSSHQFTSYLIVTCSLFVQNQRIMINSQLIWSQ